MYADGSRISKQQKRIRCSRLRSRRKHKHCRLASANCRFDPIRNEPIGDVVSTLVAVPVKSVPPGGGRWADRSARKPCISYLLKPPSRQDAEHAKKTFKRLNMPLCLGVSASQRLRAKILQ